MKKTSIPRITSFRLSDGMYSDLNTLAAQKNTRPGKLIRAAVQDLLDRERVADLLQTLRAA